MRRVALTIERLSKSGDGVAPFEGRTVFVEGALPGEEVLVELHETGKAWRGTLRELRLESPSRRAPPCALAGTCGGCDWMHLEESAQLVAKEEIVRSALEHLGGITRTQLVQLPTVGGARALGYRRRAVLHPSEGRLGFFGRQTHQHVPIERCPALTAPLQELPAALSLALGQTLKEVSEATLLEHDGKVSLALRLKGPLKPRHPERAERLVREGLVQGVVLVPDEGPVRLVGQPQLDEGTALLRADAFAQANGAVNAELTVAAAEALQLTGAEAVLELYAGNGNFTFRFAAQAAAVTAVEAAPSSLQLAQERARKLALSHVRFIQGDAAKVADALVREHRRFDRLLLDPPRTGAPGVAQWAHQLLPTRVAYVACDPAALARDAAALVAVGFSPVSLQLFDLFPQTHHIEALLVLRR